MRGANPLGNRFCNTMGDNIPNLQRYLSGSRPYNFELIVSHKFNKAEADGDEKKVTDIMTYVKSKDNPFNIT